MEYEEFDMATVDSRKRRSIINQYEQGIEVIIPATKNPLVNFVLVLWIIGWVYGEVAILSKLINTNGQSPDAILVFWIVAWTLGGLVAVLMWLWNEKGCEIIRISASELRHSRNYVLFSRSQSYQTGLISNLRLNPQTASNLEMGGGMEFWGLAGGTIAFDYNQGIYKFGLGLDEAEADEIIKAFQSRFETLR
ncbi:MAG: hypothetical protein ACC663_11690 [Gammaproteobacteria bacterium]